MQQFVFDIIVKTAFDSHNSVELTILPYTYHCADPKYRLRHFSCYSTKYCNQIAFSERMGRSAEQRMKLAG